MKFFRGVIIALSLTILCIGVVLFCMALTTHDTILQVLSLGGILAFAAILWFALSNDFDEE